MSKVNEYNADAICGDLKKSIRNDGLDLIALGTDNASVMTDNNRVYVKFKAEVPYLLLITCVSQCVTSYNLQRPMLPVKACHGAKIFL